jgi:PAS domain-containing protein
VVIDVSDHWAIPDDGLGALLDAAVEAFVVMEADGPIVGWNCAAEAMFGWSREEAVGADIAELLLPKDLRAGYRTTISRFVAGGAERLTGGGRIELAAVHRSGAERLYGYGAQEMIGASAALLRPDGVLDDATGERRSLGEGKSVSLKTREGRRDGSLVEVAVRRRSVITGRADGCGVGCA